MDIALKLKLPTRAFNALDFNLHIFLSLFVTVLSLTTVRKALVGALSKLGHEAKEIGC